MNAIPMLALAASWCSFQGALPKDIEICRKEVLACYEHNKKPERAHHFSERMLECVSKVKLPKTK
jgi:hypothetical protein